MGGDGFLDARASGGAESQAAREGIEADFLKLNPGDSVCIETNDPEVKVCGEVSRICQRTNSGRAREVRCTTKAIQLLSTFEEENLSIIVPEEMSGENKAGPKLSPKISLKNITRISNERVYPSETEPRFRIDAATGAKTVGEAMSKATGSPAGQAELDWVLKPANLVKATQKLKKDETWYYFTGAAKDGRVPYVYYGSDNKFHSSDNEIGAPWHREDRIVLKD
jgi:hypothetical protein